MNKEEIQKIEMEKLDRFIKNYNNYNMYINKFMEIITDTITENENKYENEKSVRK